MLYPHELRGHSEQIYPPNLHPRDPTGKMFLTTLQFTFVKQSSAIATEELPPPMWVLPHTILREEVTPTPRLSFAIPHADKRLGESMPEGIFFALNRPGRKTGMIKKCVKAERGLTLLEALVSMVILAVGVLGLAPVLVTAVRGNSASRDNTVATNLAREQIEVYERINPLPALPFTSSETGLGGGAYNRTTTIIDNTSDPAIPVGSCQIDVNVSWADVASLPRNTRLTTLIMIP